MALNITAETRGRWTMRLVAVALFVTAILRVLL